MRKKTSKARKIANNSKKFIWLVDSRELYLPPANLPLKYAPQPFFDASVSMKKSIGPFLIDFPFNFTTFSDHQMTSVVYSCDNVIGES